MSRVQKKCIWMWMMCVQFLVFLKRMPKLSVKIGLPSSGFFLFCRWADVFSLDT